MSTELMKLKFSRRSSVRLWHRLSFNLLNGFHSNFDRGFPWAIGWDVFWIFEKINVFWIFYEYFPFSITCDPMRATKSKRYSYKSQPKVFQLFLNFLLNDPHKIAFQIFEIFIFRFLTIFFSKISNAPLRAMEKCQKTSIIWGTSDRRAKRST